MSWAKYKRLSSSKDLSIFRRGTTASDGGGGGGNDPDAQAYIDALDAAGYTVTGAEETAINTFVLALKADGIWAKSKAIYPFIGGTAATHKFNLKDPRDLDAAFRLTFFGGWTHSATGALPNGVNGYANTHLNALANISQNSAHLSYYSRTDVISSQVDMGAFSGSGIYLLYNFNGAAYKAFNSAESFRGSLFNPTTGLLIGSRTSSTQEKYYHKGILIDTLNVNSAVPVNYDIYLACYNSSGIPLFFSSKESALASIGDGLTDTEAANFYTAVQALQTALNRNVP